MLAPSATASGQIHVLSEDFRNCGRDKHNCEHICEATDHGYLST